MKNRKELIERFLCTNGKIINEDDKEFLNLFPTYNKTINDNIDKELLYYDSGNDYRTEWSIAYRTENSYNVLLSSLDNNVIKNKIFELYPYTDIELEEIHNKKNKKKKEYKSTDKAPGKYKHITWIEVKSIDIGYINWMISVTKDNNLKKMLEEL